MKLHCHRILTANSNQIGNLRVAESAGEVNESMFRFIDDFDPAFHKRAAGKSQATPSPRRLHPNTPAHATLPLLAGSV
jgi:hypothetical protein